MNLRLMAQPFDVDEGELSGQPFPVADIAHRSFVTGGFRASFSATPGGSLVYPTMDHVMNRLVWRDRTGRLLDEAGATGVYKIPADLAGWPANRL